MSSPPAFTAVRPEASAVAVRLPGAPPPIVATHDAPKAEAAHTPPPPRVNYDPVKLQENLRSAIEHLNHQMAANGRSLGFSIDETLNQPIVTVRSTSTGEVIRQIPSEAVVRVAHTLDALKGLLHDAAT